jgi:RND family efflux transporter MFP subunit
LTRRAYSGSSTLMLLVGVGILATALGIGYWVVSSAPKPQRVKPEIQARLVEVTPVSKSDVRPTWLTGGEVVAAQQVDLVAEVSAPVVSINPKAIAGANLARGTRLATLDDSDYRLVVEQRKASLLDAEASLATEQGEAALAQEEYQLSLSQLEDDSTATAAPLSEESLQLVLRKPQLASAEAAVAGAMANFQQAQLDLARTIVRMPFNGQVLSREVGVGSYVSSSTTLFSLIGTEEFHIEVKVPRGFVPWLDMDATAEISHPSWRKSRRARILNLIGSVDTLDRQARLLLAVEDPLALKDPSLPALFANDFLSVQLTGVAIPDATVIAVEYLNADNQVWVVNSGQLSLRQLQVVYRGRTQAWVQSGFEPGDQLLVSRIDGATPGLPVRVANDDANANNMEIPSQSSSLQADSTHSQKAVSQMAVPNGYQNREPQVADSGGRS